MSEKLQVMKFGGTSVGNAECIRRAAEIVAGGSRAGRVVAVVSAMSGVTNSLIEAAHLSATGDEGVAVRLAAALSEQHIAAIETLIADQAAREQLIAETQVIISEVSSLCRGTALLRELTPRTLDAISSAGERLSARLLAATLREMNVESVAVDATEVIVTTDEHGQAEPLTAETRERATARLGPLINEGKVPVVTGFIGATMTGTLTTLGRGGSDYSATILGAALAADEVVIWTDVDGVMTADPRLVADARMLREISYAEAAELAYFGAKVLHPKTLWPVAEARIPVWIRNSFAPSKPGTKITEEGRPTDNCVKAITAVSNVSLITVGGRGMVGRVGIAAKTFTAVAAVRTNVLLISQSSSQNDICFIVEAADAELTIKALRKNFATDIEHHTVEHIRLNPDVAVVAVVGERMRGTPGIAGRLFSVLGAKGVNVIAIAQGSSEYNVSFVVEAGAVRAAVAAIHNEFHLNRRASRFDAPENIFAGV